MNLKIAQRAGSAAESPEVHNLFSAVLDPLDPDQPGDQLVLTSRRAICRVALVAAEVGGRFQREALGYDPMAWLLAPRKVFDGRPALDACLERDDCVRAILVHGLGLGLDVDRAALDALTAQDDDDDDFGAPLEPHEFRYLYGQPLGDGPRRRRRARLRLYTATLVTTTDSVMVQAFHASIAGSREEVMARLAGRFGRAVAEQAEVRSGFHPASPLVLALVPAAVCGLIRQMEADCASSGNGSFAVDIQQCIQA